MPGTTLEQDLILIFTRGGQNPTGDEGTMIRPSRRQVEAAIRSLGLNLLADEASYFGMGRSPLSSASVPLGSTPSPAIPAGIARYPFIVVLRKGCGELEMFFGAGDDVGQCGVVRLNTGYHWFRAKGPSDHHLRGRSPATAGTQTGCLIPLAAMLGMVGGTLLVTILALVRWQ